MNKQQIGILTGIFVLAIIGTIIYLNRTSEQFVKCICSQNDGGREESAKIPKSLGLITRKALPSIRNSNRKDGQV